MCPQPEVRNGHADGRRSAKSPLVHLRAQSVWRRSQCPCSSASTDWNRTVTAHIFRLCAFGTFPCVHSSTHSSARLAAQQSPQRQRAAHVAPAHPAHPVLEMSSAAAEPGSRFCLVSAHDHEYADRSITGGPFCGCTVALINSAQAQCFTLHAKSVTSCATRYNASICWRTDCTMRGCMPQRSFTCEHNGVRGRLHMACVP